MIRRASVGLIVVTGLAACLRYGGVAHVKAGSTAGDLVLELAADDTGAPLPPIDAIVFDGGPYDSRSRGGTPPRPTWFLAALDTASPASRELREIRYGTVPAGFAEAANPLPLFAGSYSIEIRAGHYRLRKSFVVDRDLTVHE
ncbi:MAG TPA: hypothetical protein VGR59_13840 [Gemmatimonadaceae bacterium]|nr:hypothetical protein [Gemmatimonadaceae bacterium]